MFLFHPGRPDSSFFACHACQVESKASSTAKWAIRRSLCDNAAIDNSFFQALRDNASERLSMRQWLKLFALIFPDEDAVAVTFKRDDLQGSPRHGEARRHHKVRNGCVTRRVTGCIELSYSHWFAFLQPGRWEALEQSYWAPDPRTPFNSVPTSSSKIKWTKKRWTRDSASVSWWFSSTQTNTSLIVRLHSSNKRDDGNDDSRCNFKSNRSD